MPPNNPALSVRLAARLGTNNFFFRDAVLGISSIPYGRASIPSASAVLAEWRGTCSTKHVLLKRVADERWPHFAVELWHRPYLVTRELAQAHWGLRVASSVSDSGLVDVHTFATARIAESSVTLDVTFPIPQWDGESSMALHCGPGQDYSAGPDPLDTKSRLVNELCDPALREPFIAALATLAY